MGNIFHIQLSRQVLKTLKKMPLYILVKLQAWIDDVGHWGINEVRKIPGYPDEPLKGDRVGQRSIRLSRSYRAIYVIKSERLEFIEVVEINHHDY